MSGGLELAELTIGYRRRAVLSGLTLPPIATGEMVAILGANAAGKSTLLRAVAGLLRARGRMTLDGRALAGMTPAERVRQVGFLPQSLPQGSSLVAYEAVLSACRATRPDFSGAAAEAAIERAFDRLGMAELALQRLDEMSGGQRQMVGLAQVLVRGPRLLLLDEPTSALDLRWQLRVLQAVRDVARDEGIVCLMAMHDINLALRFADAVAVLGGGRLLAAGPPKAALSAEVLEAAYGIEGRIESCSRGLPVVMTDRAL